MVIIAKDQVREPLFVVVPVFNPWRFKSRYKHTERALKHFADAGAVIVLVEIGFNRRELVFADSGLDGTAASNCGVMGSDHDFRHKYIGLHSREELWLKECAIRVGVQNLPHSWQQVAWFDGDIHFVRPNIVGQIIQQLQHYSFIQPFTHARDIGPNYELLPEDYAHANGVSFVKAWQNGSLISNDVVKKDLSIVAKDVSQLQKRVDVMGASKLAKDVTKFEFDFNYYGPPRVFPGLAWACTRTAWDAVGGIPDYHVWGGGDWVAGHALIGKRKGMVRNDLHPNYIQLSESWLESCERHIRRNVGVVEGTVLHHFHGPKPKRGYDRKHKLLAQIGFDPVRHLKRDSSGLWQLNDLGEYSFIQLRDTMREIARERNEDSSEV